MINFFKNRFQLTTTGAKGLCKSSITAFFYYFSFVPPLIIVLSFTSIILSGEITNAGIFIKWLIISAFIMYILTNIDYKIKYNETYKEAANLRIDIANNLKELPLSYFSKHDISDLAQTIMADVSAIEHALAHAVGSCIGFSMYFLLVTIMMLISDFKLGLCVISPIILSIIILFLTKKRQIRIRLIHYDKLRELSEDFQSAIELTQEIRSYGLKDKIKKEIKENLIESESLQWRSEIEQVIPLSLAAYIAQVSLGITIFFGIKLFITGETTLLYLIGFTIAAAKMSGGIASLYEYLGEIFYLDARIKRIGEIRNTKVQKGKEIKLDNFDIELKNVEFGYNEESKVIDGVSFKAKQNEVTALVGPSGCGKTTILRLISRLYDYDKGLLTIGGIDIKDIDTESLFDNISIVFQNVDLFNTTILENIRIGDINATDEEVKKAAQLAGCDDIIKKLPDGYDTMIGENGMRLSGGERQRISIARAFLKNADIIILDEIAASIDVENERKIQESLNRLIKDKTVIIISHRLKSIENADQIVVLNNGKVDAVGNNKELIEKSDIYRMMVLKSNLTEEFKY
ncbi:MAG: ABC transporter ATP-binding protein [Tissierellia bacterium]|nr:ABC transporter ATP-binding protein [Tissierellia bacterium]